MNDQAPSQPFITPKRVLILLTSIAAIALALSGTGATEHMSPAMLAAMLAIQPLNVLSSLFAGWRIRTLSGGIVSLGDGFKAICLANALLFLTPSRLSDLVKPIYLSERSRMPLTGALAVVAFERIIDVVIVATAVAISAFVIAGKGIGNLVPIWIGLAAVAAGTAYIILFRRDALLALLRYLPSGVLQDEAVRIIDLIGRAVAPRSIPAAFGFAILAWTLSWAMFHVFLLMAGSIPPTLESSLVTFLAASIGLVAAIAPGGIGTFEAAVVVALGLYGYSVSEALAIAVSLHVALLGYQLPLAVWVASREGLGLAEMARKTGDYVRRLRT